MPKAYKSQAQRAASASKKQASGKAAQKKKIVKKPSNNGTADKKNQDVHQIPVRVISSIVLAVAFVVCPLQTI